MIIMYAFLSCYEVVAQRWWQAVDVGIAKE